jgi:hypothetical protein
MDSSLVEKQKNGLCTSFSRARDYLIFLFLTADFEPARISGRPKKEILSPPRAIEGTIREDRN